MIRLTTFFGGIALSILGLTFWFGNEFNLPPGLLGVCFGIGLAVSFFSVFP